MSLLVLATGLAAGTLATDYGRDRALRVEAETSVQLETTHVSMERDGEPMESVFGSREQVSWETRRVGTLDTVLERADGRPVLVRRALLDVSGDTHQTFGDELFERDHDCPLDGAVLEVRDEGDGDASAEVVEGASPRDDAALEGHRTTLALDALLPREDVEEGESWDLSSEAIRAALGIDLARAYFPAGEDDDRPGRGPRGSVFDFLADAEWEGTATLRGTDEHDGATCLEIELEIEAAGDLPEPEFGERGRGRRLPGAPAAAGDNAYEVELEGTLWFSTELGRPLALEVEGSIEVERSFSREREGSEFSMTTTREGTFKHRVEVGEQEAEDDE